MYCSKCGKQLPGNSVFCAFCGQKQAVAGRSAVDAGEGISANQFNSFGKKQGAKGKKIALFSVVAAKCVVGIAAVLFITLGQNNKNVSSSVSSRSTPSGQATPRNSHTPGNAETPSNSVPFLSSNETPFIANTVGNTPGNIVNGGIVAIQGDWICYCNFGDDWKLYTVRIDGSGRKKINDDETWFINVVGDRIYYGNRSDGENSIPSVLTAQEGKSSVMIRQSIST